MNSGDSQEAVLNSKMI